MVSSIIAIIIKTELIYQKSADYVNSCDQDEWIVFLNKLFEVTSTDPLIDAQILSSMNNNNVNRETDNVQVIKTAVAHFQRFRKELVFDYDKLIKILAIQYGVK